MITIATIKFTWLLAAVALAGWLITRRHKQERWFQVVEVVVIAGFLVVGLGIVHLPNFEKVLEDVGSKLGQWTYLVVGFLAFAETGAFIGFVAPGETAVIVGGLVAGQGQISLLVLIAIVWACAVLGDVTSYELGRRLGRQWLLKHGERLKITDERLDQVEGFFERRGGATILIGRFLGFVRPIAPFIAGASKMPFRRFLPYDVLAAGAWSTTFCVLGFLFWRSIDKLTTYVSRGLFAFGTLVVVIAAIVGLIRLRRDAELRAKVAAWLDERSDQRGWRPLVKLARPAWRLIGRPAATGPAAPPRRRHRPLLRRPPHARQPRPRADHAARAARRRLVLVLPARRHRAAARRAAHRPLGRGRRGPAQHGPAGQPRQGRHAARIARGSCHRGGADRGLGTRQAAVHRRRRARPRHRPLLRGR